MSRASSTPGAPTLTHTLVFTDEFASFYDEGYIVDVLFPVKSGKEATVYCAKAHPNRPEAYYALKHYRPMEHRAFRNDAVYQEGRFAHETREVRAMRTKTRKGRALQHSSWIAHEYSMLQTLHAAGVDVPRPFAIGAHGLLIEYIGDGDGVGPTLNKVRLNRQEAAPLFARMLENIATMLSCNVVHGDLSPYNVLSWQGRLVIIDLPQAIDARVNSNARDLLARDVANICAYFSRHGVACDAVAITDELWTRYAQAQL